MSDEFDKYNAAVAAVRSASTELKAVCQRVKDAADITARWTRDGKPSYNLEGPSGAQALMQQINAAFSPTTWPQSEIVKAAFQDHVNAVITMYATHDALTSDEKDAAANPSTIR